MIQNPMTEAPCYALEEGASTNEMREMAIKAMYDELTFKWTPSERFTYRKTGSNADKEYVFEQDTVYAGLPYTTAAAGLFQWLAHCNLQDSVFKVPETFGVETKLGNSCSSSVSWGIAAVCPSIGTADSTFMFVKDSHMIALGDVDYSADIKNFNDYGTDLIVKDNGDAKVLEGYALLKKADTVIAAGPNTAIHGMMVIEEPTVVRNEDGTIDSKKSIVVVQDQRAREKEKELDGDTVSIRGRIRAEVCFNELLKGGYIAMTTREFLNNETYVKATVSLDREATDWKALSEAKVLSNYRIAVLRIAITDETGAKVCEILDTTSCRNIRSNEVHNFPLEALCAEAMNCKDLVAGKKYQGTLKVTVATGETFIPAEVHFIA